MAKHAKQKQGIAGLIFIWILVILLALGAFGVIRHYTLHNSDIISNDQLAEVLASGLEKPAGKITEEDIATLEGIGFADYGTASEIIVYLPGYNTAYDAYTAEGVTDEQKKELANPSDFVLYTAISDTNIYDDLDLFKGITSATFINYSGKLNETDVLSIVAENCPNLTSFDARSYAVNNFSAVEKLPKLEALTIYDSTLTDISAISSLENLTYLDLSETGLTDISALKSLNNDKIETIYLTGNDITDWSPLSHIDAEKIIKETEEEEEASDETTDETETEGAETETSEN